MKFYEICFALIAKRQGGIAAGLFSKRKEKSQNSCACGCGADAAARVPTAESLSGVQVLGSGCAKCGAPEEAVRSALAELGTEPVVGHVTDFAQIAANGVTTTPALVVDGKAVSYGKALKKEEAKALLRKVRKPQDA